MTVRLKQLSLRAVQILANDQPHVPSPCVSVCAMDPHSQLCAGCWRSLAEISDWSRMTDEARRQVWRRIQLRLSDVGGSA